MKLEASTAKAEEEHRVRLEQLYEEGVETHESIDAPSRLHNLQQLYSIWNHSLAVQLKSAPPRNPKSGGPGSQKDGEYFVNVGNAIRTLRSEIPFLFQRDFTCELHISTCCHSLVCRQWPSRLLHMHQDGVIFPSHCVTAHPEHIVSQVLVLCR